ncbi:uncharacterized protein LOC109615129 [Esox lucius]|uniref:Uncharacterized protein n=1 Tax=Esox lucius TaxID=8010 RepID=A0A3P8Z2C1_ESOLU|nr:uncharacterized protein LOC109615129 [Esox lucius]XP_019899220.1 uncharacterized protein LOC109615129 [Esox lucius]XP_034146962.1 uncharacterized protein LOC109615129 [Esox lucius]XP_034146963.1 uncharacterized protein LOC109615129 [Esox lucius]
MAWQTLHCYFLLVLSGSTASSFPTIDAIRDLRGIWFGNIFPRHGLHLLYWFVDQSDVSSNYETIQTNFDPARGDYGFGYYSNNDSFLPVLTNPKREAYYSVGDISKKNSWGLPEYVTESYYNSLKSGDRNRDRIIVRVVQANGSNEFKLDKVFVTQLHPLNDNQANMIDPNHTYLVTFDLLREIQTLQVLSRRNDTLAGLEEFLTQAGYQTCPTPEFRVCSSKSIRFQKLQMVDIKTVDDCVFLKLDVQPAMNGYLKMSWSKLPKSIMDLNMVVALFNDDTSTNMLAKSPVGNETSGTSDVTVALTSGLQVRLLKQKSLWDVMEKEIWRGAEFDSSYSLIPVSLKGYDASLQLYAKDGYACGRLFVKTSFVDWKEVFYKSWVGFYSGNSLNNNKYYTFQWAVSFTKQSWSEEIPAYDVYVYESRMAIAPGVQARFMMSKYNEVARTAAWGSQT